MAEISVQDLQNSENVQNGSQLSRFEIQRNSRNEALSRSLATKRFVDVRSMNLTIPSKPATGFTNRNWKFIEKQIVSFFESENFYVFPPGDLDGYCGLICGKYEQLYDVNYHGWVSIVHF